MRFVVPALLLSTAVAAGQGLLELSGLELARTLLAFLNGEPRLTTALDTLHRRLAIAAGEAPEGETKAKLTTTVTQLQALILRLRQSDPEVTTPPLSLLQYQVYRDFLGNFQRLQANLSPREVGLEDMPAELREKFVSPSGLFLIRINPAVDIWELNGARRFVNELRTVDPDVTGTPVITYETIMLMERSYRQATVYAVIFVAGISFVLLRRVHETLLSLVPLGLGLLWTVGLMPLLGLKLLLIAGAIVDIALGIALMLADARAEHRDESRAVRLMPPGSRLTALTVLTAAFIALIVIAVDFDPMRLTSGVYRYAILPKKGDYTIPFYRDGRTATVSIRRMKSGFITLSTNGKPDASMDDFWKDPSRRGPPHPLERDIATQVLLPVVTA